MAKKRTLTRKLDADIVKYKRKKWNVFELVEALAVQVKKLEKNQCKPSIKCLFEAEDFIDETYVNQER